MEQESYRRRLVKMAVLLTQGTPLAAGAYEQHLLEQFVVGQLSIEEVVALLDAARPEPPSQTIPLAA
jgi:hypothetical protein